MTYNFSQEEVEQVKDLVREITAGIWEHRQPTHEEVSNAVDIANKIYMWLR